MTEEQGKAVAVSHVLNDPSAEGVADVYSAAYLSAAAGDPDAAIEELSSFVEDVLDSQPEFGRLLQTAMLSKDEKIKLIERAIVPVASPVLGDFLQVLARHERLELLPLISRRAMLQREYDTGKRRVLIRSARALSDDQRRQIIDRLRETFSFEPIVQEQTDSSLLGGLVIRIGDTVYDGSLKKRLRQLRDRLSVRCVNEIQSGRDRFRHPAGN